MVIGDYVRVTERGLEGQTGEIIGPESQNKWWVQFGHGDSAIVEENMLELFEPG